MSVLRFQVCKLTGYPSGDGMARSSRLRTTFYVHDADYGFRTVKEFSASYSDSRDDYEARVRTAKFKANALARRLNHDYG